MEKHAPLKKDVQFLRESLAQTLQEQMGSEYLEKIKRIFNLSKSATQASSENIQELFTILKQVPDDEALAIAQTGTIFLTLANFAENCHRLRRRRSYEHKSLEGSQPGSPEKVMLDLVMQGVSPSEIYKTVCKMRVDLVLTAHPTESLIPNLQKKYFKIAEILNQRDRIDLTVKESMDLEAALKREITSIWLTPSVRDKQPSPIDEALSGFAVIEQVLWDAIPKFMRHLDESLLKLSGNQLPLENTPIKFDSWIGGDRDGNPAVTSEITNQVVQLSRLKAARLYEREVTLLIEELTFNKASPELKIRVGDSSQPYSTLLSPILDQIRINIKYYEDKLSSEANSKGIPQAIQILNKQDFLDTLKLCHRSLCEIGAKIVAQGRLEDLIRRLAVFGLSLVRLDIRQEASKHTHLVSSLSKQLHQTDYEQLTETERQKFLTDRLSDPNERTDITHLVLDKEDLEVLKTFEILNQTPRDSLGSYIISMARFPSDILTVEYLQKLTQNKNPLPVVPLFEQVEDLKNAGNSLDSLFSVSWYKNHISHVGYTPKQQVMLGYSDSAKSAGRLSAAWELYRAQEDIKLVCAKHGVVPTFFHGRGGTVSRGGGPASMAISAQPPGVVQNSMRITEQGETILEKFGILGLALRNMELYTSAVLEATLRPAPEPKGLWRETMQNIAQISEENFRDFVEKNPQFVPYFNAATPAPELSLLKIGSRPTRRATNGGLKSLRAIPWSFAWTQTRLHLPSWLGVSVALNHAIEEGKLPTLLEMYAEWPFFRSTLDLIEMVLAKVELQVTAEYDHALVPQDLQDLGKTLRKQLEDAIQIILSVSNHQKLMENNPTLRHLIETRNPYVNPLNYLQIELLRRFRGKSANNSDHADALTLALLTTINGIAAGMRNTG